MMLNACTTRFLSWRYSYTQLCLENEDCEIATVCLGHVKHVALPFIGGKRWNKKRIGREMNRVRLS